MRLFYAVGGEGWVGGVVGWCWVGGGIDAGLRVYEPV
jgi:hypothetical protein